MRREILMIGLAVCISFGHAAAVHAVDSSLMNGRQEIQVEPLVSYKKASENNPLFTQRFGADPGVMEYNGRLYVYMTDDIIEYDSKGNVTENTYSQIRTINCISSDDLVNWTDHGQIRVSGPDGVAKWAVNSWAPCAAHKKVDGKEKFFLYFCNGGNGIAVLTSDSPTGPWQDELGHPLISRSVRNCADVTWLFDPAVMVDDDGTGYLAFGGGIPEGRQEAPGTARIVKLGEDMISLAEDPVRLDVPWLFEDSGINKINGKYVYTYCSNFQTKGNPLHMTDGAIQYMISDNPLGPYTYMGELFPNEGRFFGLYGNNHHSIAELGGRYYLFYHNRPVEKEMGITGNYRSPQADRITILEDGAYMRVRGTMKGLQQIKPLSPFDEVSGATMSHQAGISVEEKDETTFARTAEGAWIRVSGVDFSSGISELTIRVGSAKGCRLYVFLDDMEENYAASVELRAGTGSRIITVPLETEGKHDIYFLFDGEAEFLSWKAGS